MPTRIRVLRRVAWACAVLCVTVVALTATARSTAPSPATCWDACRSPKPC